MSNEARETSRPTEVCEERATTWDAKRAAALRVAPRKPRGFVVRPSQTAAGRLRPHALPRGFLGATKHQRFVRHDTRPERFGWTGRDPVLLGPRRQQAHPATKPKPPGEGSLAISRVRQVVLRPRHLLRTGFVGQAAQDPQLVGKHISTQWKEQPSHEPWLWRQCCEKQLPRFPGPALAVPCRPHPRRSFIAMHHRFRARSPAASWSRLPRPWQ